MKIAVLIYGTICYIIFLGIFLYAAGFTANLVVPKGIDSGDPGEMVPSIIINVLLLSVFAVQHTIMARPALKHGSPKSSSHPPNEAPSYS